MPKLTGTATEFVLNTLKAQSASEMTIAHLHVLCEEKFQKGNLQNSLTRLLEKGAVVKTVDSDRTAYWAISTSGLRGKA